MLEEMNNVVELCGVIAGKAKFSHSGRNERYYIFPLDITRLSGTVDTINVIVRQNMLEALDAGGYDRVDITGELRSFNNKNGDGNRLVVTVFAKEIRLTNAEDKNSVTLVGTLCKTPNLRRTPLGRQICDMMIAVNRRYGRSDYLPCIAWGHHAESVAGMDVGDVIKLEGRIQSRKYIKNENGTSIERTAFEVSVVSILL